MPHQHMYFAMTVKKKSEIVLILHLLRIKVTLYVNAEHLEIFAV